MLPFFASLPNQPQGSANPALQQSTHSNHAPYNNQAMLPNGPNQHQFITPPMPNFNNFNAHLPNLHGGMLPQPPLAYNGLNPAALALLLQAQLAQLPPQQQNLLGLLQNPNLAAALQQSAPNTIPGPHNGQFCLPNAMMNANQLMTVSIGMPPLINPVPTGSLNSGFVGNFQVGVNTVNPIGLQTMSESQAGNQNSQPRTPHQRPQGHHVEGSGMNTTNASYEIRNVTRNFRGHERSQNSPHGKNVRGGFMSGNRNGGRGQHNWRERKPRFTKCSEKAVVEHERHPPVNYTEKEIQQWREQRRKNFPTRVNVAKKLTGSTANDEGTDGDAKLHRQQLKEILTKQAELGVEVAELPPGYLSEDEKQMCERKNEKKTWKNQREKRDYTSRYPNKYNKSGRQGRDKWESKRHKLSDDASTKPTCKSEPTLLQKLLSADIKRDNSKLLQVFRFMVLNSFFEHCPDKPLEFPVITVKSEVDGEVAGEDAPSLVGVDAAPQGCDKDAMDDGKEDLRGPSVTQAVNEMNESDSESISDGEVGNCTGGNEEQAGNECEESEEGEITE